MRNGKVFIIEYNKTSNKFMIKFMIETGVESFTKIGLIKLNEVIIRIIFPSNKENELSAIDIDIEIYKVTNEWTYPLNDAKALVSVIATTCSLIVIALEDSSKLIFKLQLLF